MSYDYFDKLDNDTRHRYLAKLEAAGLEECPYRHPADAWIDNPATWPTIQYADIYCYLIESPGPFTHTAMKNFRSLESYQTFRSGWVQTVFHQLTKKGNYIFKAGVKPSQRMNDPVHNPWIVAGADGIITTAHCDCMAGLGESCSHVAATLFKLEAAVRLGYTNVACTDMACQWNNSFVTDIQPAPISKINFYRDEVKDRINTVKTKQRQTASLDKCTYEEQQEFILSLMECDTKAVGLSLFPEGAVFFQQNPPAASASTETLPTPLRHLYDVNATAMTPEELSEKCRNITQELYVSQSQVSHLQELTVRQSDSVTWHDQRAGRITASRVNNVLHTKFEHPSKSLILGITNNKPHKIHAKSLEYGRHHETDVFQIYRSTVVRLHSDANVSQTGLCLKEEKPWLGATADGLVQCSCHGNGVLEIKCPYTFRDKTTEDYINDKNACLDSNQRLKRGHRYFDQVQIQMYVYNVQFCVFIVKINDSLLIDHVQIDQGYLSDIVPRLQKFWEKHIVVELLTRKLENGIESKDKEQESGDHKLYCYCQVLDNSQDGPMVGCDGLHCKFEWVHLHCIRPRRKTVPKGKWYCKECKIK